jgi:hypothetical protein
MAVCLHCLHAARVATRERRQRLVIRVSLWTLGIAVVGAVGVAATGAVIRAPSSSHRSSRPTGKRVANLRVPNADTVTMLAAMPVVPQGAPDTTAVAPRDTMKSAPDAPAVPTASRPDSLHAAPTPIVAIQPLLGPGRTDLADSLYAERIGDTVVVHFDTSPARTRRADKFEHIVRQTLHTVYGAVADTLLTTVPDGRLAAPNELLTVLPQRGIHLATPSGSRVALWPQTRPGRDGPLVIAYRTVVER